LISFWYFCLFLFLSFSGTFLFHTSFMILFLSK
jgi:hypothetical protein